MMIFHADSWTNGRKKIKNYQRTKIQVESLGCLSFPFYTPKVEKLEFEDDFQSKSLFFELIFRCMCTFFSFGGTTWVFFWKKPLNKNMGGKGKYGSTTFFHRIVEPSLSNHCLTMTLYPTISIIIISSNKHNMIMMGKQNADANYHHWNITESMWAGSKGKCTTCMSRSPSLADISLGSAWATIF